MTEPSVRPPRVMLRALGIALRAGLAAAAGVAIFDVLVTIARANQPVGFFAAVRALEAALGLYAAAGVTLALAGGVVAGAIAATLPVGETARRWLDGVRRDPEKDRAHAAGVLAAAGAL